MVDGAADHFPSTPSPYARVMHAAIAVWVAQATGRPVAPPADDLTDALIAMSNPHFLAAAETLVRAWLDAGRTDPAAIAAERSAELRRRVGRHAAHAGFGGAA